jgi:cobalt/nickel transport protein
MTPLARKNLILIAAVVVLAAAPLFMRYSTSEPFTGSDDQGTGLIKQLDPSYKPWFSSVWEPPSGEIGSLLFALQAAIGAGVLGFYIGLRKGRSDARKEDAPLSTGVPS